MIFRKGKTELEKMRRANLIVAEVLDHLSRLVKPGVSTKELDEVAEELIRKSGGLPSFKGYQGFPASVCASVNEEVVHGIPRRDKILCEGDILAVDVGVQFEGYHGDSARTFPVGQISDELSKLLEVTKESLYEGIREVKVGTRVSDVSAAIQAHVEAYGFSIVREFVGHGIGKSLHEEPQVPNYGTPGRGPRLREGMVLAIEPMVNLGGPGVKVLADNWTAVTIDGQCSAHFEHSVAVTDNGPWILSEPS
ncbi:MAG: type I methionyl aminopeptidase [Acidobacteriota bacterium]|nr:MAG: type I methionyl aminopeptidase [Acidobacteriota bacterium]